MIAATLRQGVLADLAAAGCAPLHRLGQNFMIDAGAVAALVETLGPLSGARVVEVGPGTGVLTRALLDAGARVLAIELDRGLAAWLATALAGRDAELVHGDALASKGRLHPRIAQAAADGDWLLASNLPYDAAIPILLEAAALPRPPRAIAATVQLECAQRLCSRPGDDAWGASAAVFQAAGTPRLVRRLGRDGFHPRPNVDSAIIAWQPERPLPAGFGAWVRTVFAYRRKVLPRALMDAGADRPAAEAACRRAGIAPTCRLGGLTPAELLALHAAIGNPCAQSSP